VGLVLYVCVVFRGFKRSSRVESNETSGGKIQGLIGIGRDLSDWKRQQRRFEAVFNNTYQFTGLMDPDGRVVEVNQTALSFGNLDRGDVVGKKIWETYWFQASEKVKRAAIKAVKQAHDGGFFREELEAQGAERNAIIDFSVRPVTDEDGDITLLSPEGRDITRLKEREQQLEVTNRVLRHNIRNQLNIIRGTAASLVEADTKPVGLEVESIIDAADGLFETVETTRKLNELIKNKPEPRGVDLTERVESAVGAISERYPQAEISLETPEKASVEAIAHINTAVKELLENAIVHNEDDTPQVTLSVTVRDSTVEIVVTDNAGEIPDIEQQILTGKINIDPVAHGQGIGLWYVYWIVHYSGGSIAISEQPDGSKIQILLPQRM
jgi:PAS domain S-box-containing protein